MATVRELITKLSFTLDESKLSRAEAGVNKIKQSSSKAATGFFAFGESVKNASDKLSSLSGVLSGIAAFASLRALAGVADSMQSLEARIGMLPQTIGDVGASFNEVSRHASDGRQSLEAYGSFYTKVGNAAKGLIKDQSQLLTVTDTISKALVVGGATAQEQSSAMLQFGQALGSGVMQGEEFRAMAEAAPQYMDALSEAMKIPREQLKKMASDGKLTSKAVIEATLKMSTIFEEKFRKMPMTIGGATTIIGNKFKTMVQNMNRESHVVTNVANFFLNAFDRIETGFKSFVAFVGGGTNALKLFGIALAALLGPIALGGLLSVLGAILSPAGLLVASLVLLGLAIDDIYTYMEGGQSLFGDFLKDLKNGEVLTVALTAGLVGVAAQFSYVAISYAAMWAKMRITALLEGARVAGAWLMAMGPVGWTIAAGAGIVLGIRALMNYVNDTVAEEKVISNRTGANKNYPQTIFQTSAPASSGQKTVNQINNFTLLPNTTQGQIGTLNGIAVNILGPNNDKLARDMNSQGN